jgi:hypothetical protein
VELPTIGTCGLEKGKEESGIGIVQACGAHSALLEEIEGRLSKINL